MDVSFEYPSWKKTTHSGDVQVHIRKSNANTMT